jgi:nucleoside-diphosphate-sugar epimerase
MNVLITGGLGYFGSLLTQKLIAGGARCRVFDINAPDEDALSAEYIQGDIRDAEAVKRAALGIDIIYHNVAQVPLAKDIDSFESVNIGGMKNVLRAARECCVKKVVYTSSSAVFGVPKELPVTEQTPPSPAEAYGRAKHSAETLCTEASQNGIDVSIVRPRTILGHGRLGIFSVLFEWISEGRNIPVMGCGDNLYQFVHADDLVEVCIRASGRQGSSVYNCGSARYGTMRELLEALCRHAGTGACVRPVSKRFCTAGMKITSSLGISPLGSYHSLMYGENMYFDITKIKTELDYTPHYSDEEALCESYDWYLSNRDIISYAGSGRSVHRSAVKQGILGFVKLFF